MFSRKIRAHDEHMWEFERDRAIGLKEDGWTDWAITRHMGRSDEAIKRCWQEWVNNGRYQREDGNGLPKNKKNEKTEQLSQPTDSSLSAIQYVANTRISNMTLWDDWESKIYARADRLPLTPVNLQVRLQWCWAKSSWNCVDWGRMSLVASCMANRVLTITGDVSGDIQRGWGSCL